MESGSSLLPNNVTTHLQILTIEHRKIRTNTYIHGVCCLQRPEITVLSPQIFANLILISDNLAYIDEIPLDEFQKNQT